jgi:FkbM family methyltransferase
MSNYPSNEERTNLAKKTFDRNKVLQLLVKKQDPLILDVGANNGSSSIQFKKMWQDATIHCFEPQESCWDELDLLAEKYNNNIFINKYALGDREEKKVFYTHDINTGVSGFNKINRNSKDSIDLNMLKERNQESLNEHLDTLNREQFVETKTLAKYIEDHIDSSSVDLLKIDTQGYEPQVLNGLGDYLSQVSVIVTELMFYDYYECQLSFYDIEKYLIPAGFRLYDISHIVKNPMNGRTDWVDVIYVNNSLST